jgi:hypothetical protein
MGVASGERGGKVKIKIDSRGFLYIDGTTKRCPLNYPDQCGTWCALFTVHAWDHGNYAAGVDVTLCRRLYSIPVEDFTDENSQPFGITE